MLSAWQCHHHLNLAKSKTVKMSLNVKWGETILQGDGWGAGIIPLGHLTFTSLGGQQKMLQAVILTIGSQNGVTVTKSTTSSPHQPITLNSYHTYWLGDHCLLVYFHQKQFRSFVWSWPLFPNHTVCEGEGCHLLIPCPATPASECNPQSSVVGKQSSLLVLKCMYHCFGPTLQCIVQLLSSDHPEKGSKCFSKRIDNYYMKGDVLKKSILERGIVLIQGFVLMAISYIPCLCSISYSTLFF